VVVAEVVVAGLPLVVVAAEVLVAGLPQMGVMVEGSRPSGPA